MTRSPGLCAARLVYFVKLGSMRGPVSKHMADSSGRTITKVVLYTPLTAAHTGTCTHRHNHRHINTQRRKPHGMRDGEDHEGEEEENVEMLGSLGDRESSPSNPSHAGVVCRAPRT